MASTPYTGKTEPSINPMTRIATIENDRYVINKASHPNYLSRYHGGHRRDNHPYVSGYWYFLVNPPARLFAAEGANMIEKAKDWLFTTAESFTPPSRNLTKVDVPGMGGLATSYVAGQEIGRTFSVAFREYQELPIMTILQNWTSVLDPNTGVSPLAGDEYVPANYKGSAYAALCKPTIGNRTGGDSLTSLAREDIEQIFYFDGVFPEGTPWDTFTSDISTNDTAQIQATFSFDGFPLLKDSPNVVDTFIALVNDLKISATYRHYLDGVVKATESDSRSGGKDLGTGF